MKSWCKLFGILALLPSILFAAEANPADAAKLREIKEVSWPKAYREGDGALFDKILATEFQMVDDSGTVSNKREELDYISKNRPSYKSFRYEITRLDVFENRTAVVAGTGRLEFDATDKVTADLGNNSCAIPYAPDYIRKAQIRGTIGKKRKSAKC